jgi:hypothetical protein
MVWRLNDVVVCGEIVNRRNNSVHGYLGLRGREQPVMLQLTGNCGPELAGRHLKFEIRDGSLPEHFEFDFARFATQQVGPTGRMTLDRVSPAEDDRAAPAGSQLRLHLEWFSQNGRVILEVIDPVIEFVEGELLGRPDDECESIPETPDDLQLWEDELAEADDRHPFDPDAPPEDPYGLFPDDLQWQLDQEAADFDAIGMEQDDETREIFEKWDEMFSGEKDEPLSTLFDPPLRLYPHQRLDDHQIARALDLLLARLALHGIALDMCEHYTPREAYRLLTEQILREERVYPDIPSTGFVYHYMTCEYCPQCEAEMDAEYGRYDDLRDADDEAGNGPR